MRPGITVRPARSRTRVLGPNVQALAQAAWRQAWSPGPQAVEVAELLHELGLLRHEMGRTVADERHLCHSPQERLFIDGAWVDGLLPPADGRPATLDQYRRFAAAIASAQAPDSSGTSMHSALSPDLVRSAKRAILRRCAASSREATTRPTGSAMEAMQTTFLACSRRPPSG